MSLTEIKKYPRYFFCIGIILFFLWLEAAKTILKRQWQSQETDAREWPATCIFHKMSYLVLQALQSQGSPEYQFVSSF